MPGKRLDESKRECVRKLHEYFQKELANAGPLLPLNAIQELTDLPDLVVNASPTHPPFGLEMLKELLRNTVELRFTSHLHSSVSTLTENARQLDQSLISCNPKNGVPRINIRLIWKNIGVDTELLVSHVPILGEVNLLRYLTRVITSPLSYSSHSDCVEIDSILDTCYLLARSKTKTDRAGHLVALNKSLGKSQWLGGSRLGLADIAAYSILKQVANSGALNANLTEWYERCETRLW